MADLLGFVSAVFHQWIATMSGVISLALAFVARHKGQEVGKRVFYGVAAACIFVACFYAWQDEHRIAEGVRPRFTLLDVQLAPAEDAPPPEAEQPPRHVLLSVFKNVGNRPAADVTAFLVAVDQRFQRQVMTQAAASANEVGPEQQHVVKINAVIGKDADPMFFVLRLSYCDAEDTARKGRLLVYKKWDGAKGGTFSRAVNDATPTEAEYIRMHLSQEMLTALQR